MFGVILYIEPTTDYINYPSAIARKFAEHFGQGLHLLQLYGDEANPQTIREAVLRLNPSFIFHTGHSFPCVMTVQHKQPLFSIATGEHKLCTKDRNLGLVKGRVIHSNSCLAGAEIGGVLVRRGAQAFLGSREEFLFLIPESGVIDRATMSPFLAEYTADAVLLTGGTVGQAHKERLKAFDKEIQYWLTKGKDHPAAPLLLRILESDKDIAVMYGNENARVAPEREVTPLEIQPITEAQPVQWSAFVFAAPLLFFLKGKRKGNSHPYHRQV